MALALSELSSTILVVAPGTETAVLRLYNLMHFGSPESVAALAFSQSGLVVAILAAVAAAAKGRFRNAGA
jgi:ABC-type Fe3+ transport system permease subunit